MGKTTIFLPSTRTEQRRGGCQGRLWLVRPAALQGTTAAGSVGEGDEERRSRAIVPVLALGWMGLWKGIDNSG
jgi:hypothetical protein